ncbi:hypothetical protein BV898_01463 [Hypsibius exemplaris]|uniref:Uncharacterized protein n=1 Tax=Hypsibius exemplaris TaxID=2072580 RepID=A0A1W0XBI9_HYPEX|nr:hypothetical protein BV898_01463 [Hypsibius exemplaris]
MLVVLQPVISMEEGLNGIGIRNRVRRSPHSDNLNHENWIGKNPVTRYRYEPFSSTPASYYYVPLSTTAVVGYQYVPFPTVTAGYRYVPYPTYPAQSYRRT